LKAAQLQVQTGERGPVLVNSYRVLRPDGQDTGLAITPRVSEEGKEVEGAWCVTHAASGNLISGPYSSIAQAQGLASQLSPLPWTAPGLSAQDTARAKQIINQYRSPGEDV
jgi:hypothetical protein